MGKVYQLKAREKTLGETIHEGQMTEKIRGYLQESYIRHELLYPNDPDTLFIKRMLAYEGKLSVKQKKQLEELLKYEIQEEKYPNGMLDVKFFS